LSSEHDTLRESRANQSKSVIVFTNIIFEPPGIDIIRRKIPAVIT